MLVLYVGFNNLKKLFLATILFFNTAASQSLVFLLNYYSSYELNWDKGVFLNDLGLKGNI